MNVPTEIGGIPEVFLKILKQRGVESHEEIKSFLSPKLKDLPKPEKMDGLEDAVSSVIDFLPTKKPIIIWGDYDVDGTTGTSLLVNFFNQLNRPVIWHIPNRLDEGYGLNVDWFNAAELPGDKDSFLVITVDCGISDKAAIDHIQNLGGVVIVTDHHSLPQSEIPNCTILNPSKDCCGFHKESLAGVGVAFYLAAGIRARIVANDSNDLLAKSINLKQFLAFVSLGTIADIVELGPTNRILVRAGIEVIRKSEFLGITTLLKSCGITDGRVSSEDIGFLLGPLINAAGRMGDSETVVRLLTETDPLKAMNFAKTLTVLNDKRKKTCTDCLDLVLGHVSGSTASSDKCIVVAGDVHQGVAGIVASRLVDMYKVPALVFCRKTDPEGRKILVGSARSIEGVSVVDAINSCSELLIKHGGHDMAAGLSMTESSFSLFRNKIREIFQKLCAEKTILLSKTLPFECSVEQVMSKDYLSYIQLMEPFGPGNELPQFYDQGAVIVDTKTVGRGAEHLQVSIRGKFLNHKGIGFGLGGLKHIVQEDRNRSIVFTPTVNRFRGTTSWQVRVIDIQ